MQCGQEFIEEVRWRRRRGGGGGGGVGRAYYVRSSPANDSFAAANVVLFPVGVDHGKKSPREKEKS